MADEPAASPGPGAADYNDDYCCGSMAQQNVRKLYLIEVCVLTTSVMMTLLVVFGSARRCHHSAILRGAVQGSHSLLAFLATYTIGLMQWGHLQGDFFIVWAYFMMLAYGGTDCVSAYSLEENEQHRKFSLETILLYYSIGATAGNNPSPPIFLILSLVLGYWVRIKIQQREDALKMGSRAGIEEMAHSCAKSMSSEHESGDFDSGNIDPFTMSGYRYPVRESQGIYIDDVWECEGNLLASNEDLKDICLSHALFKILCCRLAGYDLVEYCSHEKTYRFVCQGLLSKDTDDGRRSFRVIEVELAFLYDLLYTKYASIFKKIRMKCRLFQLVVYIIGCYFSVQYLLNYIPSRETPEHPTNEIKGLNLEAALTCLVIATIVLLEMTQLVFLFLSYWGKLYLLCRYIRKPNLQRSKIYEWIIHACCRFSIPFIKPWGRKLHQYSFLTSFNYIPSRLLYNKMTSLLLDKPGIGRQSSLIHLPQQVRRAVIATLKTDNQQFHPLTNGLATLQKHGMYDDLAWSCQLETQAQVIMVWHIATTICEYQLTQPSGVNRENITVATSLSKYCAYLVAFAPRLLPGHAYETKVMLDDLVREANTFLQGCHSIPSIHARLTSHHRVRQLPQGSLLKKSGDIARIFTGGGGGGDEERIWKILGDFWTEMILFLSLTGDATTHAEHLATGGQFVTHLWALLYHAGIHGRRNLTLDRSTTI